MVAHGNPKKFGLDLSISPGVNGVGEEWNIRKNCYESILGKENVLMPSREWFGEKFTFDELNEDYYLSLYKHEIFIVPGVSNIAYDVLARNGILVLMFYKGDSDINKFPWWTCRSREVLDHMKSEPNVIVCETAMELEYKLKEFYRNEYNYSSNPYTKKIRSSEIIYDHILRV